MKIISCFVLSILIARCNGNTSNQDKRSSNLGQAALNYKTIGEIPVPAGYRRTDEEKNSFAEWIRTVNLKQDSRIYLFDGRLRENQSTQFAVLDMPVGSKDLQQCADAVMRVRAEYFFDQHKIDSIHFKATDGTELSFTRWMKGERYHLKGNRLVVYNGGQSRGTERQQLEQFLEVVFCYSGTISLSKETRSVTDLRDIRIGDIFIRAGSPGHAMMVVDVAENRDGEKIFMLAQGFMPAQSIHIVKNPSDETMSPWYRLNDGNIITPNWIFYRNQLNRWWSGALTGPQINRSRIHKIPLVLHTFARQKVSDL